MKVLVTGVTGFVGNHLVPNLLEAGHTIIGTSKTKEKAQQFPWIKKIKYKPLDFSQLSIKKNYLAYFDNPDLVIHLGWSGLLDYKSMSQIEDNLMSHYFFLKNLIQHGLSNINVVGSCLEYGDYSGSLKETLSPKPTLAYPIAKNCLRVFLEQLKQDFNFCLKWIRLFYVYGEGQNPKSLVPQLKKAIAEKQPTFNMSAGEQLRDFIQVEEVVQQIKLISEQENVHGIINCCSGKPKSVRTLVEEIIEQHQAQIQLNLGYYGYPSYEPMAFWGDPTKLQTIINTEKLKQ